MKWQATCLSDLLIDAKSGFACGEDPPDGVFQFRMNNVTTEGTLDLSKKRRVPRTTRNIDAFLVESGDILFNATNSPELVERMCSSQAMRSLSYSAITSYAYAPGRKNSTAASLLTGFNSSSSEEYFSVCVING